MCEVFTDKLTAPIPSSVKGVIKKVNVKEDDVVRDGSTLFEIEYEGEGPDEEEPHHMEETKKNVDAAVPASPLKKAVGGVKAPGGKVLATPAVRGRAKA